MAKGLPWSKSAIDRSGERLRGAAHPSEQDIRDLNQLLEAHKDALVAAGAAVHQEVSSIRIVAARLKSAPSTIEKLKRNTGDEPKVGELAKELDESTIKLRGLIDRI